jgi:tRNA threonylcarbamoyladenosine biosynthesis protein TsaB
MKLLAFDTCTDLMFVTLAENETVIDSRIVKSDQYGYNSAYLITTIIDILKKNFLISKDIQVLGVNVGPGSFTGLRASITAARIMAQQLEIPVIGVSSLEIYSMINKQEKNSLCLVDARRGKAYIGIYDNEKNEIFAPGAVEIEEALELAKSEDYFVISDSRLGKKFTENNIRFINLEEVKEDFGTFLIKLMNKRLKNFNKENFNWYRLKPLYIQPPPIDKGPGS